MLKPADSGGQRGIFRLESPDDLDAHLHAALAESSSGEAIVESFHDGLELNGLAVARNGEVELLTLSDRLRPPGIGFGVGWAHLYPSTLFGDQLEHAEETVVSAIHALGLRNGIAFPQVIVSPDGECRVVEVAARIPGGQMADLRATPSASTSSRSRCDRRSASTSRTARQAALLAAARDQVPHGVAGPAADRARVERRLARKVLAFPGVVQAELYLQPGETIRPVRLDGDRRGYMIAVAATNLEAFERAKAARGSWT